MTLDIKRLQQVHKQRREQIANIKQAKYFLRKASKDLTTTRTKCNCCEFSLWDDEPEARMHRGIKSALKQAAKAQEMAVDDLKDIEVMMNMRVDAEVTGLLNK